MTDPALRGDHTIEQTLERFPALAVVFVRRGMACVGCVMAPFDTLADAAHAYGTEPADLLGELVAAAAAADA